MLRLLPLGMVLLVGCSESSVNAPVPREKPRTTDRAPSTERFSEVPRSGTAVEVAVNTPPGTGLVADPADDDTKPEGLPLPAAPLLDPKNSHQEMNKEKTLLIEFAPDPVKANPGKKKAVRVLVAAEVVMREGPLEVFLCKKNTKEHESILRSDVKPEFIHASLEAAGVKKGAPVQFVNAQSGEPEYKPASGDKVRVQVYFTQDGKPKLQRAQDWITDTKTKKPMAHDWVFSGSRFMKNPDADPNDPPYYCANNGEVIGISNFVDSMLDLPVEIGKDNAELAFTANTEQIPPKFSKVWVVLDAEPKK